MSFEDGEAYNEKLIPIVRGDVLPDRRDPHLADLFPRHADLIDRHQARRIRPL